MTKDDWKNLVLRFVAKSKNGDSTSLDLLVRHLVETDKSIQELRNKGYGWTGLSLLETIETQVPLMEYRFPHDPIAVTLLSEAYARTNTERGNCDFARCRSCGIFFVDDVMLYGSLKCPTPGCSWVLERGIKEIDEDDEKVRKQPPPFFEGYFSDGEKQSWNEE